MSGAVDRQSQSQDSSGGNLANKDPNKPTLYQPAKFMDKSGQPDNQNTSRPKGST
jgi:hypothetical protein